jgi:ABC-type Zn uptake system ZnuABC Zn-binding protein ZnuA
MSLRKLGYGLAAAALSLSAGVRAADDSVRLVTALPVTLSIATALAADTGIIVTNLPENGRRMSLLVDFFEQRADRYRDTLAAADAVVTIGKLWPEDPLFTAARSANVRVVDIDATKPWSVSLEGVSVAMEPREDVPWTEVPENTPRSASVYFWLSPANGARAAEIVARDLIRLAPTASERIERNLADYRKVLLDLKGEYETKLAELPDVTVAALAPEFIYLTSDLGIYVDGYFFRQDVDWSERDLSSFETYLRDNGIRVVIHKWEPEQAITDAIEAAGARLVVLDPIDLGVAVDGQLDPNSYTQLLRANFESLYAVLAAANR